jgi:hypothetical protein
MLHVDGDSGIKDISEIDIPSRREGSFFAGFGPVIVVDGHNDQRACMSQPHRERGLRLYRPMNARSDLAKAWAGA